MERITPRRSALFGNFLTHNPRRRTADPRPDAAGGAALAGKPQRPAQRTPPVQAAAASAAPGAMVLAIMFSLFAPVPKAGAGDDFLAVVEQVRRIGAEYSRAASNPLSDPSASATLARHAGDTSAWLARVAEVARSADPHGRARMLHTAMEYTTAQMGRFNERMAAFASTFRDELAELDAQARRQSADAIRNRSGAFGDAARLSMRRARDMLIIAEALPQIDAAHKSDAARRVDELRALIAREDAELRIALADLSRPPDHVYRGPDAEAVIDSVREAWNKAHPEAPAIAVRIPASQWEPTRRLEWDAATAWRIRDELVLDVRIITRHAERAAAVHAASVRKPNLTRGSATVELAEPGLDAGTYFVPADRVR